MQALILHPNDNVATAVADLAAGENLVVAAANITLLEPVPFGHKLALKDIRSGEDIIKYGEVIGRATAAIKKGAHVHVHNVEGLRGRGDRA
jgi:altronate dehydratase small subunit